MPTRPSSSTARARAWASVMPRWIVSGSAICRPMVSTGFRLVIGSWKTIAMSRPRSARISDSGRHSRSRPPNRTRPPATRPAGRASRRMTASAETDLPQPDSPTMAMVSPALTVQLTPPTAWTMPRPVRNSTWRSSTESRARSSCADTGIGSTATRTALKALPVRGRHSARALAAYRSVMNRGRLPSHVLSPIAWPSERRTPFPRFLLKRSM